MDAQQFNGTWYMTNITGGIATATIEPFNDTTTLDLANDIVPNSTDDYNVGKIGYDIGRPYTYNGIGNWWILVVIGIIAFTFVMSQAGSAFLLILALILGNGVIWVFVPFDWLGILVTLAIFNLSVIVLAVVRGRNS